MSALVVLMAGHFRGKNRPFDQSGCFWTTHPKDNISFSLALYTSETPERSVPNIFYEIGIAQTFGKSVYLMGGKNIQRPSDLIGLEWVKFEDINDLDRKFEDIFNKIIQKSEYYNTIGNLKFNAKNYGEAFWYYKTAYLFNPTDEIKNSIIKINEKLKSLNNNMDLSLQREIDSITKFLAFIRAK